MKYAVELMFGFFVMVVLAGLIAANSPIVGNWQLVCKTGERRSFVSEVTQRRPTSSHYSAEVWYVGSQTYVQKPGETCSYYRIIRK